MSFTSPTSSIPSSTPSSLDLHLHLHHHHHYHHHHHHHHHHHYHDHHLHLSPTLSTPPTHFPSTSSIWHALCTIHTLPTSSSTSLHPLHHPHQLHLLHHLPYMIMIIITITTTIIITTIYLTYTSTSPTQSFSINVLFVLGQPSAEMTRVGWANMWCGEMRNFFARSSRLRRSCISNAQTCGGMWISFGHGQPSSEIAQVGHPNMWQNANLVRPAQPLRTKWWSTVKNWCKIVILKVQMQAWHESQTAITVGKLRFFNVRCQRSRIGCKIATLSILKRQAQPFRAK